MNLSEVAGTLPTKHVCVCVVVLLPSPLQPYNPPAGVAEGAADEETGGRRDGRCRHDQTSGHPEADPQKDREGGQD